MEKKVTSHITKGLIISLILVVLDLVAGFANLRLASWYRWGTTFVLVAALIWACISYASQMDNNVTFGNVFGHGFKTSVVVACIMVLFTIISLFLIFPETKEIALDQARKDMEAKGTMTEDMIDKALDITRRMFLPFALLGVVIGTLLVGAISSLIGAAVAKKNPQTPFDKP